jgi:PhnB protein
MSTPYVHPYRPEGWATDIYPVPAFARLVVTDLARSAAWYQQTLGFADVFTMRMPDATPMLAHLRWCTFDDVLLLPERSAVIGPRGQGVTLSFATEDAAAIAARASEHGALPIDGPADRRGAHAHLERHHRKHGCRRRTVAERVPPLMMCLAGNARAGLACRGRASLASCGDTLAGSIEDAAIHVDNGGAMTKARSPVPEGFHTVTPQLIFDEASQAIDWYKKAFGAEEKSRALGPDGKVIHAELQIGNSRIMLNDAMGGARSVKSLGGSPIALWVYVADCDELFHRAVKAGARVAPGPMGQLTDQFWGDRSGTLTDPYGYQWTIATRKEDLSREEMDQRAQAFFKQFAAQGGHA